MTGRKIRADFVGVVYAPDGSVLKAGDEVPEGVTLGDHLLADEPAEKAGPAPKPSK